MVTLIIYSLLFVYWIENTFRFNPTNIKGFSLINILFYFLVSFCLLTIAIRHKLPESNGLNKYLIALSLVVIASIPLKYILGEIPNIHIFQEIMTLKNWLEPFLLFFVLYYIIADKATCKRVIWGLVALLMVTVIVTLLVVSDIAHIGIIDKERHGSWPIFAEPNQYGAYLVLMMPLLLSLILFKTNACVRILASVCASLTFIALICTGSRGAFLSFMFSMTAYGYLVHRERIMRIGAIITSIVIIATIVIISFILTPERLKEETTQRVDVSEAEDVDDYASGRVTLWANGLKLFIQRPVFGHGQETFRPLNVMQFGIDNGAHNDYLKFLVEHGIVGLFVFLLVFFRIFRDALYHLRTVSDPFGKLFCLSYICGFLGFMLGRFSVSIFNLRLIFWIYTVLLYRYARLDFDAQRGHVRP